MLKYAKKIKQRSGRVGREMEERLGGGKLMSL